MKELVTRKSFKSTLLFCLGITCIALGSIGVFLPILPTTPFIILAAYLFSKSSERYHSWILQNRIFGPIVKEWEEHGVINLKAKILSSTMLIALFSYTLIFVKVHIGIKLTISLIGVWVLWFIISRPSYKKEF